MRRKGKCKSSTILLTTIIKYATFFFSSAGLDAGNGNTNTTSKVRWRKDHVLTYNRPSSLQSCYCNVDGQPQFDKIFGINPDRSDNDLDLINEIGFIILDTIEQTIQVIILRSYQI